MIYQCSVHKLKFIIYKSCTSSTTQALHVACDYIAISAPSTSTH